MLQKTAAKGLLLSMGVTGAGTATVLYGNSTQTSALLVPQCWGGALKGRVCLSPNNLDRRTSQDLTALGGKRDGTSFILIVT